jgi:hypothetical protein
MNPHKAPQPSTAIESLMRFTEGEVSGLVEAYVSSPVMACGHRVGQRD